MFDILPKLVCVFCGQLTDDYWFSHLGRRECRCRACFDKGISETEKEKNQYSGNFMPVKNRDLFQLGFLEDKKKLDHVADDYHVVRFAETGSLMEYSPILSSAVRRNSARRGDISAFSVRSRSRLNRKISMLSHGNLPLFVTLTYHLDIPQNFEGYKSHLDHFFIRLLQKFPKAGIIWKLEYQFRGYAHFHLFVWNVPLADLQEFVPRVWHSIAGYGSPEHLAWHRGELGNDNIHCVQSIRSWGGVKSYASKYFSKVESDTVGGRVWGIRGSHDEISASGKKIKVSNVPFSKLLEFRCSLEVALQFRSEVARQLNFEFQRLGFWCGNYSADWLLFFNDLCNAEWVANNPPADPPDWELEFEHVFGFQAEIFA